MQSVREKAQQAAGAVQEGAQKVASALNIRGGASTGDELAEPQPTNPEAGPEPDRNFGQLGWSKPSGALEKMKESAAHAVEGVKLRLHLSTQTIGGSGGIAKAGTGQASAEQRTGESMHMAKAAEGRNQAQDDSVDKAMHDALKPEPGEKPETSDFPETLNDALAVAQMRDLPASPPTAAAAAAIEDATSGTVEPAPPNPFYSGARAKL